MLGIGMVVVLFGYGLTFFGWQVWEGCNPNLIDVFWPGKYTKCSGSSSTTVPTQNSVSSSSGVTTTTAPIPSSGTGGSVGPFAGLGPKANG